MQRVLTTRVLVEQATHALANLYQVVDKIGIPSGENGRVEIVSFHPLKMLDLSSSQNVNVYQAE